MKTLALYLGWLLFLSPVVGGQERPVPPGRRELQRYQATHPDVPPQVQPARVDPAKLQREADELAGLAESVRPDIDHVNQGLLPKDVLDKLKRIEKISKHLRSELAP